MPTLYPVGATWQFVAPPGRGIGAGSVGRVWLHHRHESGHEHWRWSWRYADESAGDGDWCPSRRLAVRECSSRFPLACRVRFVRLADQPVEDL